MTEINFANIFTNVTLGIFIVIVILATMIVVRNFQPERERERGEGERGGTTQSCVAVIGILCSL